MQKKRLATAAVGDRISETERAYELIKNIYKRKWLNYNTVVKIEYLYASKFTFRWITSYRSWTFLQRRILRKSRFQSRLKAAGNYFRSINEVYQNVDRISETIRETYFSDICTEWAKWEKPTRYSATYGRRRQLRLGLSKFGNIYKGPTFWRP